MAVGWVTPDPEYDDGRFLAHLLAMEALHRSIRACALAQGIRLVSRLQFGSVGSPWSSRQATTSTLELRHVSRDQSLVRRLLNSCLEELAFSTEMMLVRQGLATDLVARELRQYDTLVQRAAGIGSVLLIPRGARGHGISRLTRLLSISEIEILDEVRAVAETALGELMLQ